MPSRHTFTRYATLLLALLLVAPAHAASAQFGGLVRRAKDKVEQTAKDHAGATDSAAAARAGHAAPVPEAARAAAEPTSPLGPHVKEFTPDMLDHAFTALDAEQRQAARQRNRMKATHDAERADSVALHVAINATPDSAGAVAGGFGSERKWGTVKERITAFLLLDANGAVGQCMKAQRLQYIFTDAELELLRSRRAELAKRFVDKELIKDAVWGRCARAT